MGTPMSFEPHPTAGTSPPALAVTDSAARKEGWGLLKGDGNLHEALMTYIMATEAVRKGL